jgi:PTH1 family peptidyl-tRNA hydrolase
VKVIVGLGNPGAQYANTPHSVGFEAVDAIASEIGATWENKKAFSCLMAKGVLSGEPVLLVKPQTFMNLSGDSVAPVVKYHNATNDDLIVIQDDIDLASGRIRIRKGGSCGGHNGIRNIIERLGSSAFTRVKIGVGKDKSNVIGHVLGKFDPASRTLADQCVSVSVKACSAIVAEGVDKAMNLYNGWTAEGVDKK